MASRVIRILSDLHYGDRASALRSLDELLPLLDGADELVLNGDTLDTRTALDPGAVAELRAEVEGFLGRFPVPVHILTGNHDPDFSSTHALELAGRQVFVTHGDVLYEDIVPWSRDAAIARQRMQAELAALPPTGHPPLERQFLALRRAAAGIPPRERRVRHGLAHVAAYVADTAWPPSRPWRIIRAWREAPARALAFVRAHGLPAKVVVIGHTHRLGFARRAGMAVVNTGSFAPMSGTGVVDVTDSRLLLRRVVRQRAGYRIGPTLFEFALATTDGARTLRP